MTIINEAWTNFVNVAESFPSSVAPIITLTTPTNVQTEFFYNFFEPDETVSYDPGYLHDDLVDPLHNPGYGPRARFVKISWQHAELLPLMEDANQPGRFTGEALNSIPSLANMDGIELEQFVMSNLGLVNLGDSAPLMGSAFSSVLFQDLDLDGKMFHLLSGSFIQMSANAGNSSTTLAPALNSHTSYSLFDAAVSLANSNDDSDLSNNILVEALTGYISFAESVSGQLLDESGRLQTMKRTFDQARDLPLPAQINNKFIKSIMRTCVNDPLGLFSQEFAPLISHYTKVQNSAILNASSNVLNINSDDWSFDYVTNSQLITDIMTPDANTLTNFHYIGVGYLLTRVEYSLNIETGKHEIVDPDSQPRMFYVPPGKNSYNDIEVLFGNKYQYMVRHLALVFLPSFQSDSDGSGNIEAATQAGAIIASSPVRTDFVDAVDLTPPPPPSDFQLDWDFTYNALRLTWSLPVTTKKNIVKFQIFRRGSINDPLVLVKEYNFDPRPFVQMQSNQYFAENPMPGVVQFPPYPPQIFFDADFRTSSRAIYTMCAVSASSVSSVLTPQFEVYFDQKENRLVRNLISASGAQKSMPNRLIESEVFVDTMATSGFSQVRLFFDPEYLIVKDSSTLEGKSLRLLSYNANSPGQSDSDYPNKYRMNFYNADLQKSRPVDIILLDLTQPGQAFCLAEQESQSETDASRLLFD